MMFLEREGDGLLFVSNKEDGFFLLCFFVGCTLFLIILLIGLLIKYLVSLQLKQLY